jgi:hypothetical protein
MCITAMFRFWGLSNWRQSAYNLRQVKKAFLRKQEQVSELAPDDLFADQTVCLDEDVNQDGYPRRSS